MDRQVDMLIRNRQGREMPRHVHYDGEQCLDVLDLTVRATIRIRAEEVSPYRHSLMMDGTSYEILNVYKRCS